MPATPGNDDDAWCRARRCGCVKVMSSESLCCRRTRFESSSARSGSFGDPDLEISGHESRYFAVIAFCDIPSADFDTSEKRLVRHGLVTQPPEIPKRRGLVSRHSHPFAPRASTGQTRPTPPAVHTSRVRSGDEGRNDGDGSSVIATAGHGALARHNSGSSAGGGTPVGSPAKHGAPADRHARGVTGAHSPGAGSGGNGMGEGRMSRENSRDMSAHGGGLGAVSRRSAHGSAPSSPSNSAHSAGGASAGNGGAGSGSAVKVVVRVRPLSNGELAEGSATRLRWRTISDR